MDSESSNSIGIGNNHPSGKSSVVASEPIDLSVVVPLYNEEESVPELLRQLDATLGPLHREAMLGGSDSSIRTSNTVQSAEAFPRVDQRGTKPFLADHRGLRCEIVLVDDGSRDETYRAAIDAASGTTVPVRIVSLQRNFGQTAAMQAGIDASSGELIATMDGDLQNDPADLPMMVDLDRRIEFV